MQNGEEKRVPFAMRVKVPESVLLQEVEGEIIALSLDTQLYLGLNKSGKEILEHLVQASSIDEAYAALLDKYDVEPSRLRTELSKFLETLLEQGLIELCPP